MSNLKTLRENKGWSQGKLAEAVGTSGQQISLLEAGKRKLTKEWAEKLAPALGATVAEVLGIEGQQKKLAAAPQKIEPSAPNVPTTDLFGGKDFPIYASAEGGGTGMTISYEPIEYVWRPGPLVGVKNAFGFYVIGESMSPMFRPGWIILVHPTRPPQKGDAVLVTLRSTDEMSHDAMVKILEGWKDEKLVLSQLNPAKKLPGIPKARVQSIQLIVGTYFGR